MKNNKIIEAYDEIQPDVYAKQRVLNRISEPKRKRRFIPAMAGLAAVLAVVLLVNSIMPAEIAENFANSFTVRAFAFEQQADGTIIRRDINLAEQRGVWGGFQDFEKRYINVNLDVTGENIEHVEFRISNGEFAKQYHNWQPGQIFSDNGETRVLFTANEETQVLFTAVDEYGNHRIAVYGTEFEKLGNRISLNEIQAENILLFIVIEGGWHPIPDYIEIEVYVTFADGETQTETLVIDLTGMGILLVNTDHDDTSWPQLDVINLACLTLIPESVQVLQPYDDIYERWGDWQMYVWDHGDWETFHQRDFIEENDGIGIMGFTRRASGEEWRTGAISIIDVDEDFEFIVDVIKIIDGEMVGMKYIMSAEIAYEWGFR